MMNSSNPEVEILALDVMKGGATALPSEWKLWQERFKRLSHADRVQVWTLCTSVGIDNIALAKKVHANFRQLTLEADQTVKKWLSPAPASGDWMKKHGF
jgi:hypothetical protein